jgi:hypothetical protein
VEWRAELPQALSKRATVIVDKQRRSGLLRCMW